MGAMMFAWIIGVPAFLLVMVLVLDRIETYVVAPIDRAARITKLLQHEDPDVLERQVAQLLAPVAATPERAAPPFQAASESPA